MQSNRLLIHIICLSILVLPLFLFSPRITSADNLFGQSCGTTRCSGAEVCQKQYRGVLPVGPQNNGNATFTCVRPQNIEAPDSPYKGVQNSCNGIFKTAFGLNLDDITGDLLTNTLQSGLSLLKSKLGLTDIAIGTAPGGFQTLNFSAVPLNWSIDPTNLINTNADFFKDYIPRCESAYNNIKGVINTNFLVAPLPVDIFNPLPLPVNVTSPTPLPVVVVDDLALYQQKELIDAPLAAQQKAKTIATVSDTLRYQISADNLMVNNYFSLEALGIQFGALDPNTGVVSREALDIYGSYQNFSIDKNNELAQYFRDRQDQKSELPPETFSSQCGNIPVSEAGTVSLECVGLALLPNNNPNDIAANIALVAKEKATQAAELLDQEVRDGSGFLAKTKDGNKNPFTKVIETPASNIAALTDKVVESTIDQAILASGDNCFEAIPNNILEGSLKPVLTQGLFGGQNLLASVQANPTGAVTDPNQFANQLRPGGGIIPDPNQFFQSLQNTLLQNVTSGLSCELNKQISGLLNGAIGNINIPGIGNVSGSITNAATSAANNALNNAVNNLIP